MKVNNIIQLNTYYQVFALFFQFHYPNKTVSLHIELSSSFHA